MFPWLIKYPNVNDEIQNLDWILDIIKKMAKEIEDFIGANTIKYADPIAWDISRQYEGNTVVVDPGTGDAYISTHAVPAGYDLTHTEYWTKIFNYGSTIDTLISQIATNEGNSPIATANRAVGDLVFINGILYEVTSAIVQGAPYMVNTNIVETTIETVIDNVRTDLTNLNNSYNEFVTTVNPYLCSKKILILGDSLASEYEGQSNWVTALRNKYAHTGTIIDNYARSGDTLAGNTSTGCVYQFQNAVTDRDYDIIIIQAGINDYFQQFPIGQLNPTFNTITWFQGALTYFNDSWRTNNPSADVFYICPPKSNYELDHALPADIYRMLIFNACNNYGWHFIDAYAEEPYLSIYNSISAWTDGIHPNSAYTPILANYFDKRLNTFGGNYLSYAKNRMSLTAFCTEVYTGCTLALEFDTTQHARLTVSCNNMTYTEANGITLAKLPDWLHQVWTTYGHGVLNGVYLENVHLLNGQYVQLIPNRTATGNIRATFEIFLNLDVVKVPSI